ncbi:MAG TPA: hypothetical protein VL358_02165 [Caulobacteraceae bacterium]|jgi:hypothetical protein|nr:hypothetical protein [Caulobacteraceae bacterium]
MQTGRSKFSISWLVTLLIASFAFSACSREGILAKIASPEDQALATKAIADLQRGQEADADLLSRVDPRLRGKLASFFPQMRAIVPAGVGSKAELVDAKTTMFHAKGVDWRQSYLAYDVSQGGRHALVRLQIVRRTGTTLIETFVVNSLAVPAEKLNAFTVSGKSAAHYLILIFAALSVATIVASEIILFATPGIPRKCLWAIGCLLGIGRVAINWSSGVISFSPLAVQLLGAFALKAGLLGPWMVGFGLPIVSLIFLIRRKRLQRAHPSTVRPAQKEGHVPISS